VEVVLKVGLEGVHELDDLSAVQVGGRGKVREVSVELSERSEERLYINWVKDCVLRYE
jgi:hypothetical protein